MPVAPVAAGDIVQVLVEYRLNEQRLFNVFHYRYESTPTTTEYFAAMAAVNAAMNEAGQFIRRFIAAASEDIIVWSVSSQRVTTPRSPRVELSIVDPGAVAGPAAPQNVCLSITRRVDAVGRGYNGRVQLPGLPASGITSGLWNSGLLAAIEPVAATLTNVLEVLTDPPNLYPVTHTPGTAYFNTVIGTIVHEEVRTMHRRTVRLGI